MRSIKLTISKLRSKQSLNNTAENVWQTYLVLDRICPSSPDISGKSTGFVRLNRTRLRICLLEVPDISGPPRNFPKFKSFFSTLILELQGTKLNKTLTQGSPQHKEYIPKRGFFHIQIFPFRSWINSKT
jgi:hypothetical protein